MMASSTTTKAAALRAKQGHPTIDVDGHMIEYGPVFLDYLQRQTGPADFKRFADYAAGFARSGWYGTTPEEKLLHRVWRPPFWARPATNTLDRATAMIPGLRRTRMDDFGIDFSIIYPTLGLSWLDDPNDEFRPQLCRAYNAMAMDMLREHADRMTPVAVIPTFTPAEAIAELEHAVTVLGYKAIMVGTQVRRTVPAAKDAPPEIRKHAYWMDPLALDSIYDYDPLWRKCAELKVAVTGHNLIFGQGSRRSISNFMFNHIGHFAQGGQTFAKALFLGGVTKRFPTLNFAFLEGGAAWACELYNGVVSRWNKRSREAMDTYNPAKLDIGLLNAMLDKHGGASMRGRPELAEGVYMGFGDNELHAVRQQDLDLLDDFAKTGIKRAEEIQDQVVRQFYFGAEADDPLVAVALNGKHTPFGARLNMVFGSDQGHWDVVDMLEVVEEAFELVEHGLMDEAAYRDFMFTNGAMLHAGVNRDFFKGTIVESDVAKLLAERNKAAANAAE